MEYIKTIKLTNGCFCEIYKKNDIYYDKNGIEFTKQEIKKYI